MAYRLRWTAIGLVAVLLLGGCVSMTGKTAGENIDDATITAAVKAKLAADTLGTLTRVSVDSELRTVYLTGVVENEAAKQRAEELTSQVRGVHGVVNNLVIQATK